MNIELNNLGINKEFSYLTENKEYLIIEESSNGFKILDDTGEVIVVSKLFFNLINKNVIIYVYENHENELLNNWFTAHRKKVSTFQKAQKFNDIIKLLEIDYKTKSVYSLTI